MYVKIVSYLNNDQNDQGVSGKRGNSETPVVPTTHWVFEAEEVNYKKVRITDFNSLGKGRCVTGLSREDKNFEVLEITLGRGHFYDDLIARKCTLYLMNNEGRTIDTIVCR